MSTETTPTPNPPPTVEEKTESNQENRWALWFFKNDKSKTWQLSSNLMTGCDYSFLKDGIESMWEDEKNKRGRRWLITLNKYDDVCRVIVNVRAKGDKIAIWTTECENREERLGLPPMTVIGYQSHAGTATQSGSTTKNRFIV
ncbi:hypothetical protein JEQ12_007616 [Ovis aries]|uniref:Uncharacterized protein n=1 Tax=Ovis aries TaxID=9940 RepID=A0A835ZVT5_SHEEP|nr:hypothetical protein JEQ12_007616 [Ovis aries]